MKQNVVSSLESDSRSIILLKRIICISHESFINLIKDSCVFDKGLIMSHMYSQLCLPLKSEYLRISLCKTLIMSSDLISWCKSSSNGSIRRLKTSFRNFEGGSPHGHIAKKCLLAENGQKALHKTLNTEKTIRVAIMRPITLL